MKYYLCIEIEHHRILQSDINSRLLDRLNFSRFCQNQKKNQNCWKYYAKCYEL